MIYMYLPHNSQCDLDSCTGCTVGWMHHGWKRKFVDEVLVCGIDEITKQGKRAREKAKCEGKHVTKFMRAQKLANDGRQRLEEEYLPFR